MSVKAEEAQPHLAKQFVGGLSARSPGEIAMHGAAVSADDIGEDLGMS
jgi:hypothetical protein